MFFFDGVLYFFNIFIYFENDSLLFLFDIFDMFQKQFRVLQPPCLKQSATKICHALSLMTNFSDGDGISKISRRVYKSFWRRISLTTFC